MELGISWEHTKESLYSCMFWSSPDSPHSEEIGEISHAGIGTYVPNCSVYRFISAVVLGKERDNNGIAGNLRIIRVDSGANDLHACGIGEVGPD